MKQKFLRTTEDCFEIKSLSVKPITVRSPSTLKFVLHCESKLKKVFEMAFEQIEKIEAWYIKEQVLNQSHSVNKF